MKEIEKIVKSIIKKETTWQDIWNFKNLIEQTLIKKIIKDLKWVDNKIFNINKEVAIKKLINKYQKMLKL